jgi:glycosyltransferase involved in cell wall biosynthesis
MAAPRTLHIVLNGVTEDSRVLKCAWSLGNAGWDVVVTGATPFLYNDEFRIGHAKVVRLPLKIVLKNSILAKVARGLRYYKRRIQHYSGIKTKKIAIPNLGRSVKVLTPLTLEFKPDVIHAHDYTALPIAAKLIAELKAIGFESKLVYDAHEYVPGVAHLNRQLADAYANIERKAVKNSSAILSVSEGMSDLLIPHLQISKRPEIVANDPLVAGQQKSARNLRSDIGVDKDVPVMVYSGAVAPQRGVDTAAQALSKLLDVHLVIIANPKNQTVIELTQKYSDFSDRIHVLPYVPNAELVSYLSEATLGLIPLHHKQNHEISLITKFGEYMQAKLPILVSDVKTMSEEVKRLGNGEVFIAKDVADFVNAAKKIINNPAKYSSVYTEPVLAERSWERQAENLVGIYNRISKVNPTPREMLPFIVSEPVRR